MLIVPVELRKDAQINAAIATVLGELSPWVRHIRYRIGKDWSDDWAVFFNVVLSDEAADRRHLRDISSRVTSRITDELDYPNLGMFPYFNFRSESEQAELNDPEWSAVA
jgi:hypothetical protein